MDNSNQHTVNHHPHIYDPELTHVHHTLTDVSSNNVEIQQEDPAAASTALNPDASLMKRRPGRPKGSTKKNLLAGEDLPPKLKRPVGRPRKDGLPAGSVGPSRTKRESVSGMVAPYPGASVASFPYGFSLSAPIAAVALHPPPPGVLHVDAVHHHPAENDWADLARANSNAFLSTLLVALHAPNPVSTAGPTVEDAFKSHLVSLTTNHQFIPSLYSILKTFWLPSSPAYFSLTASTSTARIPSEHRFLYWDPQPLVFNGISCPNCSSPLVNNGRINSGPIKIYDIGKPFYIVGCEYVCRSNTCAIATNSEGRKFASTDPAILRSLPAKLKDEFPAKLLHGDGDIGSGPNVWNWRALGVSTSLWNLVIGALRSGLRKEVILGLIWGVQNGVPDYPSQENAQQAQPQYSAAQVAQQSHGQEDGDKMDDDEDDVDVQNEDQSGSVLGNGKTANDSSQAVSSTSFTDAYGAAWNENTATTGISSLKQASVQQPAPQLNIVHATSIQPPAQPPGVSPLPPNFKTFPSYPFAQYAYMAPHIVNAHIISQTIPTASSSVTPVAAVGSSTSASAGPSSLTASGSGSSSKRSPRHCSKCGSQECKGKGGRSFCTNPCQDCGKLDCKGRNSRRPDKKCGDGWQ